MRPDSTAAQEIPDVVARDVLRVCADPHNMPFSNRKGQGFENRIAEILADELKIPLRYYWLSQGPGFVANTLGIKLCDVVMGYAAGCRPRPAHEPLLPVGLRPPHPAGRGPRRRRPAERPAPAGEAA